jgi:hypothetical protein
MYTQVLGISVDSVPCLNAWADSLGGITYPLLSDFYPHGDVAKKYRVLRSEGYSERAIFVIDKKGIIRYIDIHNIDEQPDNQVLFSVLAELEHAIISRSTIYPMWKLILHRIAPQPRECALGQMATKPPQPLRFVEKYWSISTAQSWMIY